MCLVILSLDLMLLASRLNLLLPVSAHFETHVIARYRVFGSDI